MRNSGQVTREEPQERGSAFVRVHGVRLILAIAVLGLPLLARAVEPLVVHDQDLAVTPVAPHLEVLVDPAGRLSLEEVTGPALMERWKPEPRKVPSFGFTADTLWLRFTLRSGAQAPLWVSVDLATARLSHVRWHVMDGGRLLQTLDAGSVDRLAGRGESSRFPLLRIELPPGAERRVVLRVTSNTSIWLPLTVAGLAAHDRMDDNRSAVTLLQVGFCLGLTFLALLLGVMHRQRMYLSLIVLALSYAIYLAGFNGYLRRVWPGMPHWVEREGLMMTASLGVLVFLRLNASLIRRELMSRTESVMQRVAEGLVIAAAASFLVLDYRTAAEALNALLVGGILAGLVVAISRLIDRGGRLEVAFTVAWATLSGSFLLLALSFLNLIPMAVGVAMLQSLFLPTVLCGFFAAVAARQHLLQQAQLQVERSRAAETEAQLETLRYQINPHFLFNTLTSIDGLARTEPGRIPRLVSRLATFLRLRLEAKPTATLREELDGVLAYLEIEQTRFGEDLQVACDAAAEAMDWPVPELILQPLAENAVKHGMRSHGRTLISIRARVEAGRLVVSVSNPGSLAKFGPQREGFGVGLENIRRRLALLYGDESFLTLAEGGGAVTATVVIPALRLS